MEVVLNKKDLKILNNIYDKESFFKAYQKYRKDPFSLNNIVEQPFIRKNLPIVKNQKILDLGSGFGDFCEYCIGKDCKDIIGVDSSKRMIIASKNLNSKIKFVHDHIELVEFGENSFDIVSSSLALHYIENLDLVFKKIQGWLKEKGVFIFTVNHPYYSAKFENITDDVKERLSSSSENYALRGFRKHKWLDHYVSKYHRTLEDYLLIIKKNGFFVDKINELYLPNKKVSENTLPKLIAFRLIKV
ncbi:MAG: class I SAM-dependent methyltransferase [Chitinophagales bacterium]